MRNQERGEAEMAERRELMLNTGFSIFAEKGIESVPMQEVAKKKAVRVPTVCGM